MRDILNKELRLREWQQGDGFNYHYNRIKSLTVFDQTANTLRNYECSARSVNWGQYFEHEFTDKRGTVHHHSFATCDAENRIALWDIDTGECIQVFERRGFDAGQAAATRASQQQMDQVNGHTGPVNGCLFLPASSPEDHKPPHHSELKVKREAAQDPEDGDDDMDSFNSDETLSSSSDLDALSPSSSESESEDEPSLDSKSSKRDDTHKKGVSNADPDANDTHHLLSWSADGTIKVWGLSSGRVLFTLTGHGGAVTQVQHVFDAANS